MFYLAQYNGFFFKIKIEMVLTTYCLYVLSLLVILFNNVMLYRIALMHTLISPLYDFFFYQEGVKVCVFFSS